MSFWWWIAFAVSVALLPLGCRVFYRNACLGGIRWLNVAEIVAAIAVIAYVVTSVVRP